MSFHMENLSSSFSEGKSESGRPPATDETEPRKESPTLPIERKDVSQNLRASIQAFEIESIKAVAATPAKRTKRTKCLWVCLDRLFFPVIALVCSFFVVAVYMGTHAPVHCSWIHSTCGQMQMQTWEANVSGHSHLQKNQKKYKPKHEDIAVEFADRFDVRLEVLESGEKRLLSPYDTEGSETYAVKGGESVLRVQEGDGGQVGHDAQSRSLISSNIPHSATTLVHFLKPPEFIKGQDGAILYTGWLASRHHGPTLDAFIHTQGQDDQLENDQILTIAGELAVALHTLHNKIDGYVVLHCAMEARNVATNVDDKNYIWGAMLTNFGHAIVHKLQPGQDISAPIFHKVSSRCSGTDWKSMKSNHKEGTIPFNAFVEWRELGFLIYLLAEEKKPRFGETLASLRWLFVHGDSSKCSASDVHCIALENMKKTKRLKGKLLDLTTYLLLNHTQIRNELEDVLKHPAFGQLTPSPAERAQDIEKVQASDEFQKHFQE